MLCLGAGGQQPISASVAEGSHACLFGGWNMLPMAVIGAQVVEAAELPSSAPEDWTWTPQGGEEMRRIYAVHSNRTTSRMTNSKQMDSGTSY